MHREKTDSCIGIHHTNVDFARWLQWNAAGGFGDAYRCVRKSYRTDGQYHRPRFGDADKERVTQYAD